MQGLYVHIPFCAAKCHYCDFASYPGQEAHMQAYIRAVLREAERIEGPFAPETVFWGGGTPSLLPAESFAALHNSLARRIDMRAVTEYTLEANPGTVDGRKLAAYAAHGVNRLSFGLQAAQDTLLQAIGRRHTPQQFAQSVNLAHKAGIRRINGDMMTGLPGQTVKQAEETAQFLIDCGVTHVSCYALKVEEGTPLYTMAESGCVTLPDDDAERDMFHAARAVLEKAGFVRYEISNFALPGEECRHNLLYWQRGEYYGLGCAAASFTGGERRVNTPSLQQYIACMEEGISPCVESETLSAQDAAFEEIMLALRLQSGLDLQGFAARHGYDVYARHRAAVDRMAARGLLTLQNGVMRLTAAGMDVQNSILLEFM